MFEIDIRTKINQPIEDVFERLIDIDAYPDWLPASRFYLSCQQTSQGEIQTGTTFIDETRIGTYHGEVTTLKRPTEVSFVNRLAWLGLNVMESHPSYRLQPLEVGTEIHHYGHGRLYGLFQIMEPYVARYANKERRRTVHFLKKSFEE